MTAAELDRRIAELEAALAYAAAHPWASWGCGEADAALDELNALREERVALA